MNKPNFFIVGAPKCGTTALAHYLSEHPQIFVTDPKEPNYFSRELSVYQRAYRSIDDYLKLYEYARPEQIRRGEASVWSMYSHAAVPEILSLFPGSKFIVMVRNPVDMAVSLHSQMVFMTEETELEFAKAWCLQEDRFTGRFIPKKCREPIFLQYRDVCSLGSQLRRLRTIVPASNLKTIIFDEFVRETANTYRGVLEFLEIADDRRESFQVVNANRVYRLAFLQNAVVRSPRYLRPFAQAAKQLFGIRRLNILSKIQQLNERPAARIPLDPTFRQTLIKEFDSEICILEHALGRDLSAWRK